jgi:hypothetical protein
MQPFSDGPNGRRGMAMVSRADDHRVNLIGFSFDHFSVV